MGIKGKKKDEDNHLIPMKTSKYDKFIGISNISTWFTNMWSTVTSSIIPSPISSSDFVSNVDKKRKKKKKHLNSESKDGPKEFIDEEMGGVGAKPISLSPSKNKKDKNDKKGKDLLTNKSKDKDAKKSTPDKKKKKNDKSLSTSTLDTEHEHEQENNVDKEDKPHQNRFWKLFGIEKYDVHSVRRLKKCENVYKWRDNDARGDAGHVFKFTGELERQYDLKKNGYHERSIIPLPKPWYTRLFQGKQKTIPEVEATRYIIDLDRFIMEPEDVSHLAITLDMDSHPSPSIMVDHSHDYSYKLDHDHIGPTTQAVKDHWGLKKLNIYQLSLSLAELRNYELLKTFDADAENKIKKLNRQWGLRSDRLNGSHTVEFHKLSKQRESLLKKFHIRRPMQIRTTPMENFTNNIKGLFKTIPPIVTDFETTFVKDQIDLNKNLYPVNNVGDLICQANEAAQLSAAVIDRQIEFSKLSDELKGRSLLIHFISDLMGHDDPHELVFRRHAETSHIPPVGEYTLFCKTREMPWILTWAVSSSIIFLGDVFLIESASIWFVKVALTSLIGKNMNDIATKLDLHLSILLPKVIRRDNRMITARRNNFASISMKNINNINDKSNNNNNNISVDSIKLSEYESDYEWKKKHVNACEILFVSNYIAKKENFRTLPESKFILEYRDPYPENSGHFWHKASLDIDKSTHKVAVIVDYAIKQGLEWILMMLGLNLWGFCLSSNKNLNPVSSLLSYNNNKDDDDEQDDENDFFKMRTTEWNKTSLEEVLCDGFDRAQEKLQEEDKVAASIEREKWLDNILTKEERKKLAVMEKKRKRLRAKNDSLTIFEYLFLGYLLAFAALPLHIQHFRIEILLSLIFIVLWGAQQEMGTLGYMGGGIVTVLTTLIAPKLPGAFFWLLKKILQILYAPFKLTIIIISYPFKLIKRLYSGRSNHHHHHSHLLHIEDEDKINATGGKGDGNNGNDSSNLTYQLNDDEQKAARNRGEAFNNTNKDGNSIWQWVTLGSNPEFPQFKAKSNEIARLRTVEDISLEEQEEAKAIAEAEALALQNKETEDDEESLVTDAYSSMTEVTDLSSNDENEDDVEDEYYDWVANNKENNKFLVIQKERVKLEQLIVIAKRWRRYREAVIQVGRIELARQKEDMKAYRWQQEKKKIKILVREAARRRRIREAFIIASHERKRDNLIEKLKWKRIRVYYKAEAKRIFKVRVELMKKMRRLRQHFKLAAWEQRERNWMNDEEEYMNNFLEKESELNTNNDMIEEEEYLRKTFEELDIMEENERKLMAYDEWQQIEGRRILRNAMKKELLRECK